LIEFVFNRAEEMTFVLKFDLKVKGRKEDNIRVG